MPENITLRGPAYSFECLSINEAKRLGVIDSESITGTHEKAPVTQFVHGEGLQLKEYMRQHPATVLIATGRYAITAYQLKRGPVAK